MSISSLKATLIHLRLPFSIFLAPVYLFALSESKNADNWKAFWIFIVLHLLLFPASNAYNSYYDKDEGSIGLVKNPPPTSPLLLYTALLMDILAISLSIALNLGWFFVLYLLLYGIVSKSYSHPGIRLKKYPVVSLLIVAIFQGLYTYMAVYVSLEKHEIPVFPAPREWLPAIICTLNLLAVYPLTQVYQHEEDRRHGDMTYSRLVGIRGTFRHATLFFGLSFAGFAYWYLSQNEGLSLVLLSVSMLPALVFFQYWQQKTRKNPLEADYSNTMRMNALASAALNFYFILLCMMK